MTTTRPPAPADRPAAGAGPTPDEAAWIRAHAWTPAMRKTHREIPAFYTTCACEWGQSIRCNLGQHDRCGGGTPRRDYEALICGPDGSRPMHFAEPYAHKTDTSAAGPQFTSLAQVWLADRVCRWGCPCDCHTAPAKPAQDALFEVTA